jgi:hypothetical protein
MFKEVGEEKCCWIFLCINFNPLKMRKKGRKKGKTVFVFERKKERESYDGR